LANTRQQFPVAGKIVAVLTGSHLRIINADMNFLKLSSHKRPDMKMLILLCLCVPICFNLTVAQTKFGKIMHEYPKAKCLEFIKNKLWLGKKGWEDVVKSDGSLYFLDKRQAKKARIRLIPVLLPSKNISKYDTSQSILDYLEPKTDVHYLATISKDDKLLSILEAWHSRVDKGPLTVIYTDFDSNMQMTGFKSEFETGRQIYFDLAWRSYCSISGDSVSIYNAYEKRWQPWNERMKDALVAYRDEAQKYWR
jgi:hypothetical protein